jgi:radical SAM superfamily enzyme YgiQ (UPF0313 family)
MKGFVENNSDYTVNIYNLSLLKRSLPEELREKFKHLYKKDASILHELAEVSYPSRIVSAVKKLKADLFAVDLHWLVFTQGGIQILKLLKQLHPQSYTVTGGMTASYFKDEIMNLFPFIDFLVVGDGCIPILKLIEQIKHNKDFTKVPNVLYREKGKVKSGTRSFLNDFEYVQNGHELIDSIPTSRGCPLQCITCGGSNYSSKNVCGYTKTRAYSIESIMKKLFDLAADSQEMPRPFLIHDPLLTLGKKNWKILLDEIKKSGPNVSFLLEFFFAPL